MQPRDCINYRNEKRKKKTCGAGSSIKAHTYRDVGVGPGLDRRRHRRLSFKWFFVFSFQISSISAFIVFFMFVCLVIY